MAPISGNISYLLHRWKLGPLEPDTFFWEIEFHMNSPRAVVSFKLRPYGRVLGFIVRIFKWKWLPLRVLSSQTSRASLYMTGREFERSCSSRVVRCPANGAQTRNVFRERPRSVLSKLFAQVAANAWRSAQTKPFATRRAYIVSIMPDVPCAANAAIIAIMAHLSNTARP